MSNLKPLEGIADDLNEGDLILFQLQIGDAQVPYAGHYWNRQVQVPMVGGKSFPVNRAVEATDLHGKTGSPQRDYLLFVGLGYDDSISRELIGSQRFIRLDLDTHMIGDMPVLGYEVLRRA